MSNLSRERFSNILANSYGQFVTIGFQVLQVPVLLKFFGISVYGDWILLTSLPQLMLMLELSLGVVVANQILKNGFSLNDKGATKLLGNLNTCLLFLGVVILLCGLVFVSCFSLLTVLDLSTINRFDANLIFFGFLCKIVLQFWFAQIRMYIRLIYTNSVSVFYGNTSRLFDCLVVLASVVVTRNPVYVVFISIFSQLVVFIISYVYLFLIKNRRFRHLMFTYQLEIFTIKEILSFGLANTGLQFSLSLVSQLSNVLVGSHFGSQTLVEFNASKTVARLVYQMNSVINNSSWPLFPRLFSVLDFSSIRRVLKTCILTTLLTSAISSMLVIMLLPLIAKFWLDNKIDLEVWLIVVLLTVNIVSSFWGIGFSFLSSINKHRSLSLFVVLLNVLSIIVFRISMISLGLLGAVGGLLVFDCIVLLVVYIKSRFVLSH